MINIPGGDDVSIGWLLIFPGALVLGHTLYQIRRGGQSRHWPTVGGTIDERIVSRSILFLPSVVLGGRRALFRYSYEVAGARYSGRRVQFGTDYEFSIPNAARYWLGDAYPPGRAVTVRYDPDNPAHAVLRVGTSPGTYVLAVVSVALMLGGVALMRLF